MRPLRGEVYNLSLIHALNYDNVAILAYVGYQLDYYYYYEQSYPY